MPAPRPRQRYSSAAELAADLRRFLVEEPVLARPLGPGERLWNWCRRPERFRDATIIGFIYGTITTSVSLIGLAMALSGELPGVDRAAALIFFLPFIALFGPVELWAASRTSRRSPIALWFGLLTPFAALCFQGICAVDLVPVGQVLESGGNSNAWLAQVVTIAFQALLDVVCYVLALLAYYASPQRLNSGKNRPPKVPSPPPL